MGRAAFRTFLGTCVLLAAISVIPTSPAQAVIERGSILPFIKGAGGREVVVPDGVYSGGNVTAPHADWLVLRAETPGGVVVDMADTGLRLDDGTSKVMFVGFKFVNGSVRLAGVQDLRFWYCDFSFPIEEWNRQYKAVGGPDHVDKTFRDSFVKKMVNPFPTALFLRKGVRDTSLDTQRVRFYGTDFHDIGDDGMSLARSRSLVFQGIRVWKIEEKNYDPGRTFGPGRDWFHNDGIQVDAGALTDVVVADSWLGQKLQWAADRSNIVDARFRRLWLAGSSNYGNIMAVHRGGRLLRNLQKNIRAFANGQRAVYSAKEDRFRTDFVDGVQMAKWPAAYSSPGSFEVATSGITTSVPAGIVVRDGMLVDIAQVRDHPQNPANWWRLWHPYTSWRQFLELP